MFITPAGMPARVASSQDDLEICYPRDEVCTLEEGDDEDQAQRKKKIPRKEKVEKAKRVQLPRRFSRRLAGFSAAVQVVQDLDFHLSSEEDDCEDKDQK